MNSIAMIAACMERQVAEPHYLAPGALGTPRLDPDPVNHETLTTITDHGIEGYDRSERGLDDERVLPAVAYA